MRVLSLWYELRGRIEAGEGREGAGEGREGAQEGPRAAPPVSKARTVMTGKS